MSTKEAPRHQMRTVFKLFDSDASEEVELKCAVLAASLNLEMSSCVETVEQSFALSDASQVRRN